MQKTAQTFLSLILLTSCAMYAEGPVVTSTTRKWAAVAVDVQNDFCQGGALAVPGADKEYQQDVRAFVALARAHAVEVYKTEDAHPPKHISFASRYGLVPFSQTTLENGDKQDLWPDHCIEGTEGAESIIDDKDVVLTVKKGTGVDKDSYSGATSESPLIPALHERDTKRVTVFGLAGDYCVPATATDLISDGKYNGVDREELHVIANLSPSVDLKKGTEKLLALQKMRAKIWVLHNLRNLEQPKEEELDACVQREMQWKSQAEELRAAGIDVWVTSAHDYFGDQNQVIALKARQQHNAPQ